MKDAPWLLKVCQGHRLAMPLPVEALVSCLRLPPSVSARADGSSKERDTDRLLSTPRCMEEAQRSGERHPRCQLPAAHFSTPPAGGKSKTRGCVCPE
ncbi:hypothetical protein NDU88_001234 [Pleurodeles waltl]|uniref:Uncharacterized protein n=1 Tax=Pleurodeles waltl TaxID=8319 RepID=A0AAV7PBX7_PLEWA|nr:hypothetical protein NDU88_001234 [Pleurodeles waltl]